MKVFTGLILLALIAGIVGIPALPVKVEKGDKEKGKNNHINEILEQLETISEGVKSLLDNKKDIDEKPAMETILDANHDAHLDIPEGDERPNPVPPNGGDLGKAKRNIIEYHQVRAPNGVFTFRFSKDFDDREDLKKLIRDSMHEIQDASDCIVFKEISRSDPVPKTGVIEITGDNTGCWSYVGWWCPYFTSSVQQLNLMIFHNGYSCCFKSVIQHELFHALGTYHEHVRSDRDQYIKVNFEHIQDGQLHNFEIQRTAEKYGLPFDPESIMQYPHNAFSKDGQETMTCKDHDHPLGGHVMSKLDKEKLNKAYQNVCRASKK